MTLRELRDMRQKALQDAQKILDTATTEKRSLTTEERTQFDLKVKEAENHAGDIARLEQLETQQRSANGQGVTGTELGLSNQEIRRFSMVRLLNALATPSDPGAQRAAAFEFEVCAETAKLQGKATRGAIIPMNVGMSPGRRAQLEGEGRSLILPAEITTRDLTVGTNNAGGYAVATDLLSGSFIDMLYNAMALASLGITRLDGLQGNISIPKKSAGATAYWVAESGSPSESQPTLAQVTMSPKTIGAYTDYSRRLMLQSSLSVEQFVRNDLAQALALGLDLAGIHGTGSSNQPTGILATSGIGDVAGGTNGDSPTWADIVALESAVSVANAAIGNLAYLTNAKVRGKLKTTEKASSTGQFVWGDGANPLNGYNAVVSNQVSSALTKGTADSICSAILFGNWADLMLGLWGGLEILTDPYTGSTSGTVRVVALQSADYGVRHAGSFAAMQDALTT